MRPPVKNINRSYVRCILAVLIITCAVMFSCSDSDKGSQADPENAHTVGAVWAMVYPTNLALRLVDHTYVSARDIDGNSYDWLCFGYKTEGEELVDTRTEDFADITTVGFMASEPPCKWPYEYYLRIGVCYQCANRALYYTGKTVAESKGYDFFTSLYGTYGDENAAESYNYSMENCINSAPEWQGMPSLAVSQKIVNKIGDNFFRDAEARLYRDYLQTKSAHSLQTNDSDLYGQYLDTLFEMRIRKKLGNDFPSHVVAQLVDARNRYRRIKISLDQEFSLGDVSEEKSLDGYRRLFNGLADDYKKILTPLEYEALFNLSYSQPIELDGILPR